MKIIEINSSGATAEKEISRKNLIAEFAIRPRDLWPIFSRKHPVAILRRGSAIILNFRSIRAIIGEKKFYLFNAEKKTAEKFLPFVIEKIKTRSEINFEHIILDAAFLIILEKIKIKFDDFEKISVRILKTLDSEMRDENFEQLLAIKKQISKLGTKSRGINEILQEILDDDEKIEYLFLCEKKPNIENLEFILEEHFDQIEDVVSRIDELNENIDDSQEILTLKMASLRNTIIKFDLVLTSLAAIFAVIGAISGIYGMNLHNGLEKNHAAFFLFFLFFGALFLIFSVGIFIFLKRKKIF